MEAASAASIISSACDYAARGWRVFPLRGKVPLAGSNGCHGATADPDAVASWPSDVNVGIATGSGLVVLDVDYQHDGGESLHELERAHSELPRTASVVTGGYGQHYYFASRARVRNSAGKLGRGLDVRGEGGYVVGAPSIHPDTGRPYEWDNHPDETGLAPLPRWLEQFLAAPGAAPPTPASEWRQLVANGVPIGERNQRTAQLAGHLLGHRVDPYVVLELLVTWDAQRNQPPLGRDEVTRTVDSIAARETRKIRGRR